MTKSQVDRPFSLHYFSLFQLSKQLWAEPELKRLLILCIKEIRHSTNVNTEDPQNQLCAEISRRIDELSFLPNAVKNDLWLVVSSMGKRLEQWGNAFTYRYPYLEVDLALYVDHICWAHYGYIDSSATLRAMYHSKVLPADSATWNKLCDHCLEDCINDLWPTISETEKHRALRSHSVISFYWCHRLQNDLEDELATFKTLVPSYKDAHSLEENMVEYFFALGNYAAFDFFWKLLKSDRRKRVIIQLTNLFLSEGGERLNCGDGEWTKGIDFLIFLREQLTFYELNHWWTVLFLKTDCARQLLGWPFHDLFMEVLEEFKKPRHPLVSSVKQQILPYTIFSSRSESVIFDEFIIKALVLKGCHSDI